jgi:Concanavalin A-like lectin/glucanases superfamily
MIYMPSLTFDRPLQNTHTKESTSIVAYRAIQLLHANSVSADVSGQTVTLHFSGSYTGVNIYRGSTKVNTSGLVTGNSYVDSNLPDGTTYSYSIVPVNAQGMNGKAIQVNAMIPIIQPLFVASNFIVSSSTILPSTIYNSSGYTGCANVSMCCDKTGQYIYCLSPDSNFQYARLLYSYDSGATFVNVTSFNTLNLSAAWCSLACSGDGKYIYFVHVSSNKVYRSTNGADINHTLPTFTQMTMPNAFYTFFGNSTPCNVTVSDDGSHVFFNTTCRSFMLTNANTNLTEYTSSILFTDTHNSIGGTVCSTQPFSTLQWCFIFSYYAYPVWDNSLYYTKDYGATWNIVPNTTHDGSAYDREFAYNNLVCTTSNAQYIAWCYWPSYPSNSCKIMLIQNNNYLNTGSDSFSAPVELIDLTTSKLMKIGIYITGTTLVICCAMQRWRYGTTNSQKNGLWIGTTSLSSNPLNPTNWTWKNVTNDTVDVFSLAYGPLTNTVFALKPSENKIISTHPSVFNESQGLRFKIKGSNATVPTMDATGTYALTNVNNSVSMVNDATRGYVLSINGTGSGSNFGLLLPSTANVTTPQTRCAWINIGNNATSGVNYGIIGGQNCTWNITWNTTGFRTWAWAHFGGPLCANAYGVQMAKHTWYHLALVFTNTDLYLYVNGAQVDYVHTTSLTMNLNTDAYRIGSDFTAPFPGLIDDARVYNYALTSDQIQMLYTQTL